MLLIKRSYLFILAILITAYAVPRDELLWLWVSVILVILGIVNLRKDSNNKLRKASGIGIKVLIVLGIISAVIVIGYLLMFQSYSSHFDR